MLSRRWIINYVLIVLIIVFTYVGNRFDVQTGQQKQNPVTSLKAADVHTVEIQTADEFLTLRREDGGWTLTAPIQWPANSVNIERLLNISSAGGDSRLPADEIDLASLGLQFPRAMLRLNDRSILFGASNNIGERRYVMIDDTVYLLPDVHLPFISQGLLGLVDRRLLPRRYKLQSLKLPEYELARGEDQQWRLAEGGEFDSLLLAQLVENWQGIEASRVQKFDAAATPRQKVLARLENGAQHEFFVMSIAPEIVIAHPELGLQYHFSNALYYGLLALRADETSG